MSADPQLQWDVHQKALLDESYQIQRVQFIKLYANHEEVSSRVIVAAILKARSMGRRIDSNVQLQAMVVVYA